MAALECVCADVFRARCDVEPASCALAWTLVIFSMTLHAWWMCCPSDTTTSDDESDDGVNTMYS